MALDLPVVPAVEPMLAKAVDGLPDGDGWLYEPKWDGFRAIVFRDGDEVFTQSRDLKPLDRYFPELARPAACALPNACVVDGEVVIARDGALDFEALLLRIHPAASRVNMLAAGVAGELRRLGPPRARRRGPSRRAAGRAPRPP
jgi:ATP-dependent DNA ligase